jgi:hypothetical protein
MGNMGNMGTNGTNGLSCWDANNNGVCDQASEDINKDNVCDAKDCIGATGPVGLFKRATFSFASIPVAGMPGVQLSTITFTPPTAGTAIVSSRGYCNMTGIAGAENGINIGAATAVANAFTNFFNVGVVRLPNGAPATLHQAGFTSEITIPITAAMAGMAQTINLYGRHEVGNRTDDCSGSFTVQFVNGTLP